MAALLLFLFLADSLGAALYRYQDLGNLGGSVTKAYGINDLGQVVGESQTKPGVTHAFLWEPASVQMQDLFGSTPGPGAGAGAWAINNNGQIIGWYLWASEFPHAFLLTPGFSMQDLGTLGDNIRGSWARGINNLGQVVGNAMDANFGNFAVLWPVGTSIRNLGTLGGGSSTANGINDAGQIVGSADTGSAVHAFLWQGTMQDLGTLGGANSYAYFINQPGQVVGSAETGSGTHAFLWQGTMQDLGTLGGSTSTAYGINDAGQVVGSSTLASGATHAMVWSPGIGPQDLNNLVPQLPPGIVLQEARGINSLGQIAGTTSGNSAFLLSPVRMVTPAINLLLGD